MKVQYAAILMSLILIGNTHAQSSATKNSKAQMPKQYIGSWADGAANCKLMKSGVDAGVIISVDTLSIGTESTCKLNAITKSESNQFTGQFSCSSEGETSKDIRTLSLNPQQVLTLTVGKESAKFIKCGN